METLILQSFFWNLIISFIDLLTLELATTTFFRYNHKYLNNYVRIIFIFLYLSLSYLSSVFSLSYIMYLLEIIYIIFISSYICNKK